MMNAETVIREARGLIDGDTGLDPEYVRAVVELTIRVLGLSDDDKPTMYRLIAGIEAP